MAASVYSNQGLQQRHRSQSDSNLLSPQEPNGAPAAMVRVGSVGDLSSRKKGKTRRFFHRLVRPWKWRKKNKFKDQGKRTHSWREDLLVVLREAGGGVGLVVYVVSWARLVGEM